MANFMVLLKKNIVEMIRNKKVLIFAIVFVAISLISALSARYLPEIFEALLSELEEVSGGLILFSSTVADSYVQFISNIGEMAVLLIAILFATSITKEKTKGTYNNLITYGVKDKDIVLAHYVSQLILITVCYLLSVAVFTVLNILLFSQIMGLRGVVALTYMYLLLVATLSFTLFCSCLCNKNGKAYLFVILGYFVVSFLEVIPKVNVVNPIHLLSLATELMYYPEYVLSEHIMSVIFSIIVSALLVIGAVFVSRSRIKNCKMVKFYDNTERI